MRGGRARSMVSRPARTARERDPNPPPHGACGRLPSASSPAAPSLVARMQDGLSGCRAKEACRKEGRGACRRAERNEIRSVQALGRDKTSVAPASLPLANDGLVVHGPDPNCRRPGHVGSTTSKRRRLTRKRERGPWRDRARPTDGAPKEQRPQSGFCLLCPSDEAPSGAPPAPPHLLLMPSDGGCQVETTGQSGETRKPNVFRRSVASAHELAERRPPPLL